MRWYARAVTDDFDERLQVWMDGLPGVTEPRRVIHRDASRIFVSKFEDGFAAHLHDVLDRVPELFDAVVMAAEYAVLADTDPSATRAATWRAAIDALLVRLASERGLTQLDVTNVRGGLDSVSALLDSTLWSSPAAGDKSYSVQPGELDAYHDVLARMEGDASIFTRVYGTFEGATVVNYCPAAAFGRRLFLQAWAICTGAG